MSSPAPAAKYFFGHKKFNTPILKTMAPFIAAGLIVTYGINAAQTALSNSEEFKNDPRNLNARSGASH